MRFKKYDIILVNFPFSNLKESKIRPALVVMPLEGENTILCQITTKKRNMQKYEIFLRKKSCEGNIRFNSYIYIYMIFTLHESLIVNKIGTIKDEEVKKEIDSKIKQLFEMD